jgi:signal transduction histidine kinase
VSSPSGRTKAGDRVPGLAFIWAVVLLVSLALGLAALLDPKPLANPQLLLWTGVLATVELLPVTVSRQIHLSLGFPILLGVAILYTPPNVAATVALIGSFDSREIRGQISPVKSLFNRCQIALSTLVASATFHSFASVDSPTFLLLAGALAAVATNYCVNLPITSVAMRLLYGMSFREYGRQFRFGAVANFLLNYLGLGFVGVIIATLFSKVGFWSVASFILPLVFARQMFFRTMALEEAHKELKERGEVLRALSNRMAEERQDERMRIAAYLHDDLAQMLFRLNLQAEMAKKRLLQGDAPAVSRDLDGILRTKQETSDAIRALIRDLHRSPIGRRGLAEALESFAEDMSKGPTRVVTDVVEVSLPPPITLLIYQIAREATMNALKHAEAGEIRISLADAADGVTLTISDDGRGFDINAPQPEGHFGSVMMRERALVAGGSYSRASEIGKGTTITATFPSVWIEEGSQLEAAGTQDGDHQVPPAPRPPIGTTVGPQKALPLDDGNGGRRTEATPDAAATKGEAAEQLASLAATSAVSETTPQPAEAPQTRSIPA